MDCFNYIKRKEMLVSSIQNASFHIDAEVPKGGVRKFGLLPWPSLVKGFHSCKFGRRTIPQVATPPAPFTQGGLRSAKASPVWGCIADLGVAPQYFL